MSATAHLLPDARLHLHHGPIDCLCQAWGEPGEVTRAYHQAAAAFPAILPALLAERPHLATPLPTPEPQGAIARAMHRACAPFAATAITPMAAVAGAVADHLLAAMTAGRRVADALGKAGLIGGAVLALRGHFAASGPPFAQLEAR